MQAPAPADDKKDKFGDKFQDKFDDKFNNKLTLRDRQSFDEAKTRSFEDKVENALDLVVKLLSEKVEDKLN